MTAGTVFPQKHTLPSAEAKTTIYEGDDLGRAGERHLDEARHIIRAFIIEWNHPPRVSAGWADHSFCAPPGSDPVANRTVFEIPG